ncbi:MAG: hypothetical protein QOH20_3827 [Mycobacterium sp.]|nr:hypothetical protein [Mycobacterium sp.]
MVPRAARRVRLLWNSTFVVVQDVWASALSQSPCGRPNGPDCARGHRWRCPANSPGVRTIYDALCGRIQYLPRPQSSGDKTRAEHWIARLVNTVFGSRFKTIGTQRDSDNACAERCGESHQARLRSRAVGVPRRPAAVGNVCHWCHRTTEWVHVLRTDASSCGGAPTRTLSQPPLHTGWHAPDGHAPDALDLLPPEHLSPREAWRLRDGAVLRAHDVQPHVDEVCLALTWRSLLGCNLCSSSWVPARQESLFGGPRCSASH